MMRRIAAAWLLAIGLSGTALAADLQQLTRDTQRITKAGEDLTFVWWMPQAWWEENLNGNPALTAAGRSQVLAVLDDYIIFSLARNKVLISGMESVSRSDMLAHARFEVGGKVIEPIEGQNLSPAMQGMLASFKPALASMLGKFGQSLEIVVYPGKRDGQSLVDPLKSGSLQYTFYGQTFTWRLPLGSLLPPKVDPKTNEEFPGNYDFNPYSGDPLRVK
ncbi:MAG TPA: hypothetical protein VJQ49_08580 [Casimicrobiaceae bacterium]|nr:hypothetical protein [Casimicrobiaceae bacterium]